MQEGQVPVQPVSAQSVVIPVQSTDQELFSLSDLLDQYWHVSRCWANYELAVRDNMTVEAAIYTLRRVCDQSRSHPGGDRLSRLAHTLLRDIVENCQDDPRAEAVEG